MKLAARIVALWLFLVGNSFASDGNVATMPVDQIRAGQKGYGLSVFSGADPERFEITVIGVLKNVMPHQDVILMRGNHPSLNKTGAVAGMSGSPIFIDDKLVGALAFGWAFSLEPVFGVTPIASMLDIRKRKVRVSSTHDASRISNQPLISTTLPREGYLKPVTVPLSVSGLSQRALAIVNDALGGAGFAAVQGGGSTNAMPSTLKPGSAVAVTLVRGDIGMHAVGTVTWTDGRQMLAFGHSMYNAGQVELPIATAWTHHHMVVLTQAFKVSSPGPEVGALVQDRQAGILGELTQRAPMIPLEITLRDRDVVRPTRVAIARHDRLTPILARTILAAAISESMSDATEATFTVDTTLKLQGYPAMSFRDEFFSETGVLTPQIMVTRGQLALDRLIDNEFKPVVLESIGINVDVKFGPHVADIVAASIDQGDVEPGKPLTVYVTLRPHRGKPFQKSVVINVPKTLAGSVVTLEISGGQEVTPERAPPQRFDQLLRDMDAEYPPRAIVVGIQTPLQGVKIGGEVVNNLPYSVIDSLRSGSKTQEQSLVQWVDRQVFPTEQLIRGSMRLNVRVKDTSGER